MADYKGRIVHPQTWPKDIDLAEKNVLVIGSGDDRDSRSRHRQRLQARHGAAAFADLFHSRPQHQ